MKNNVIDEERKHLLIQQGYSDAYYGKDTSEKFVGDDLLFYKQGVNEFKEDFYSEEVGYDT